LHNSFNYALSSPVLVTGGAGFIGSHLVEALVKRGLEVRVIDNLSSGRLKNLESVISKIDFHVDDIRNRPLIEKLVKQARAVFHLAGMSSVPQSQLEPSLCLDINGQGTLNVLELAAQAGVSRLVYASTSAVYGDLPAPHREELRPSPDSPYAAVKLLGEHLGHYFRQTKGLLTISLRFFNVYGPRQSADGADAGVIPIFLQALKSNQHPIIYGNGQQTRDFIHVTDVVQAAIQAALVSEHFFPSPETTVFNVGTGHSISVIEVLKLLQENFPGSPEPVYAPARPGDPLVSEAIVEKAKSILRFEAKTNLKDGVKNI
jgi:UDP-glucose 4-epimerase